MIPIAALISGVFKPVMDLISKSTVDATEKAKIEAALQQAQQEAVQKALDIRKEAISANAKVVAAEATGNFLQRAWRPAFMYAFLFIVVFNYIITPVAEMFGVTALSTLSMPPDMWDLIKLGFGGYVVGRSVEKTAKVVSDAKKEVAEIEKAYVGEDEIVYEEAAPSEGHKPREVRFKRKGPRR